MDKDIRNRWKNLKRFVDIEDIPQLPHAEKEEWIGFFVPALIKAGAVPKKNLIGGKWYYGDHRRCTIAKWNKDKNLFEYARYKFGWRMDECNHFEDDDKFALFVPIREATEEEVKKQEEIIKEIKK